MFACNCDLKITLRKNDLIKYTNGKLSNFTAIKWKLVVYSINSKSELKETVMASEIYFTNFVTEYDFSIQVRRHLQNIIKTVSPDSEVAKTFPV